MKKRHLLPSFIFTCALSLTNPVYASKSKPFSCQEDAERYLIGHYKQACRYYREGNWRYAADEFEKVIHFFPASEEAIQASYYLGVCFYEMKEYDFANTEFSNYIKAAAQPAFFEEAVAYKFDIAEHFKCGKKRRPFKMRYFPKWISGQSLALVIYDEVVVALPNHELAVSALYAKADLLQSMGNYREAVDAYQTLIRRFPRHERVPECYLRIAQAYCLQSAYEFQNPDILAFAELNVRKFRDEFPRDERVEEAEGYVRRIKEMYAKGLCDIGLFYERKGKPDAAAIYYQSSIEEFPDTQVADFCRSRLLCLGYPNEEEGEAVPSAGEGVVYQGEELPDVAYEGPQASEEAQPPVQEEQQNFVNFELPVEREEQSFVNNENEQSFAQEEQPAVNFEPPAEREEQPFVNSEEESFAIQVEPPVEVQQSLVEEEQPIEETSFPIIYGGEIEEFDPPHSFTGQREVFYGVSPEPDSEPVVLNPNEPIQEEVEPAPYFIHYSLLKKKEVERRPTPERDKCKSRRRYE